MVPASTPCTRSGYVNVTLDMVAGVAIARLGAASGALRLEGPRVDDPVHHVDQMDVVLYDEVAGEILP